MTDGAGPRRYRVQLEVSVANISLVIGTLVDEVEPPKMEPCNEGMFRVTFIARQDQLSTVIGVVDNTAEKIYVVPYEEKVLEVLRPYESKPQSVFIPPHVVVKKIKGKIHGRTVVDVVVEFLKERGGIAHIPDIHDRLVEAGYATTATGTTLSQLKKAGKILGLGQGAYKLP